MTKQAVERFNKAEAIRSHLAKKPNDSAKDIAAALSEKHGIEFTAQYVDFTKWQLNSKKKKVEAKAKPAKKAKAKAKEPSFTIENLVAAKNFANLCGGVENANKAIQALTKIWS
jgi:predicted transcriptional regulator